MLQVTAEIKTVGGGDCHVIHACGGVYSKDVSSVFIPGGHVSVTVAMDAGKRRGNGLAGRHNVDTEKQRQVSRNVTAKAGSIGSGSEAGNQLSQKQLTKPRG